MPLTRLGACLPRFTFAPVFIAGFFASGFVALILFRVLDPLETGQ